MKQIEPFSLSALEGIAKIIAERYTGQEITQFFKKAGFPQIQHDGTTKWRFVYAALEELQKWQYGHWDIAKVIQKLCDPQEYFGQAEYHKSVIERINEILSFYGLQVDLRTGKVIRKPSIEPSLRSRRSEAEELFDSRDFHPEIRRHARLLFIEGKHFHGVFECCKAFDRLVGDKSGINKRGPELMGAALSPKGPLKLNAQITETQRNEQEGVMHLCMGLMRAIRNPEAHEPELDWPLTQKDALDILSLISFLWSRIDDSVYFSASI